MPAKQPDRQGKLKKLRKYRSKTKRFHRDFTRHAES
jgi:hypothetical protein